MNFTFVIYSKKNRDKYYRHLSGKMKGWKIPEKTNESKEKELYYKYLQALSSQVRIVIIKVNSEIQKSSTINNEILKNELENCLFEKGPDDKYILGIHMKTRIAHKIPDLPYSLMENDPKIIKFKKYIDKKNSKSYNQWIFIWIHI